jgi:hypothetical protein
MHEQANNCVIEGEVDVLRCEGDEAVAVLSIAELTGHLGWLLAGKKKKRVKGPRDRRWLHLTSEALTVRGLANPAWKCCRQV